MTVAAVIGGGSSNGGGGSSNGGCSNSGGSGSVECGCIDDNISDNGSFGGGDGCGGGDSNSDSDDGGGDGGGEKTTIKQSTNVRTVEGRRWTRVQQRLTTNNKSAWPMMSAVMKRVARAMAAVTRVAGEHRRRW